MPRLQDVDEATYICPTCHQAVRRARKDFQTPGLLAMFGGRLPAYLLCGRCYSAHPRKPATHMWRTDVREIDRRVPLWGSYGSSTPDAPKGKETAYQRIRDVSFAKCRRFVATVITDRVIKDTGALLKQAEAQVKDVKSAKGKVNAVAVHFATTVEHAVRGQFYAVIDWAPNGAWADADTVNAGEYKTHQYAIIRQHQTKKEA